VAPPLPEIQEGLVGGSRVGSHGGWREEATDHELEELRRSNFDLQHQLHDQSEELRRLRAIDREADSLQEELQQTAFALDAKHKELQKAERMSAVLKEEMRSVAASETGWEKLVLKRIETAWAMCRWLINREAKLTLIQVGVPPSSPSLPCRTGMSYRGLVDCVFRFSQVMVLWRSYVMDRAGRRLELAQAAALGPRAKQKMKG